jgi:hypothetical protein
MTHAAAHTIETSELPADNRPPGRDPLALLRRAPTLRARCAAVTQAVADGLSPYFKIDRQRLEAAADFVATVMQERHPDGRIPAHGVWRHLQAGGVDRVAEFDALLAGRALDEQARARFDLAMLGVLLAPDAGPQWRYAENAAAGELPALALPVQRRRTEDLFALLDQVAATPLGSAVAAAPSAAAPAAAPPDGTCTGSDGLAIATFRAFVAGVFSAATDDALRADAATLRHVDATALRAVFQVTPNNPLAGLDGRAGLLARLGDVLQAEADRGGGQARPGLLYDRITAGGTRSALDAGELLGTVLRVLAPLWPTGILVSGVPAGDVWPHRWAGAGLGDPPGGDGPVDLTTPGWVPFHMPGQWLVYSLVEPLALAGVQVTGLDALTALPEAANGGLLLDMGVIVPRNPRELRRRWRAADEIVVEWRALTVTLIDELAQRLRERLGRSAEELPLAAVLEGGTRPAGQRLAQQLRAGEPALKVEGDGTLF